MRYLPLPDGGTVTADYTFYWEGGTAQHEVFGVAQKSS